MNKNRFTIKVTGESGQGVNLTGELLAFAIKYAGYNIFGYREYPSLIRGGVASYQIDFSDKYIASSHSKCDILVAQSRASLHKSLNSVSNGGIILHDVDKFIASPAEREFITQNDIRVVFIKTNEAVEKVGIKKIMSNIVMLGAVWKTIGINIKFLQKACEKKFGAKPAVLELNLKALDFGYNSEALSELQINLFPSEEKNTDDILMTGNEAISLGAVAAGVRAFYSYPMTPSSSILSYLAKISHETGMLVKQAEDEITAAQMTIGSSYAGTRALVATSGGGFDLMTESLSHAAMTETPFVCILAQRPGPATGLPTWTSASDLNLAIHSGHGEYVRCVIAASDPSSAYDLIQKAFNISEILQIPVIVLTEKQIAESIFQIEKFEKPITIERGLVNRDDLGNLQNHDRFKFTQSGVSPRWVPGSAEAVYNANSDEHQEDGSLTEEADEVKKMIDKRMNKISSLMTMMPEPELFSAKGVRESGETSGDILCIGWGSVKNMILDAMSDLNDEVRMSYLHFDYVYPLKTERILALSKNFKKIITFENNYTGQFAQMIEAAGVKFDKKFLKYDGRAFFVDEVKKEILDFTRHAELVSASLEINKDPETSSG